MGNSGQEMMRSNLASWLNTNWFSMLTLLAVAAGIYGTWTVSQFRVLELEENLKRQSTLIASIQDNNTRLELQQMRLMSEQSAAIIARLDSTTREASERFRQAQAERDLLWQKTQERTNIIGEQVSVLAERLSRIADRIDYVLQRARPKPDEHPSPFQRDGF